MTKSTEPLVSIITPVYNAERFLNDTIKTVQNQNYKNWELLLIDDRSSDDSVNIIKSYQTKDKRVKLLEMKTNSGAALTRNRGIKVAKGEYIAFLDADDLWEKGKLKKQVKFMQVRSCEFSFTGYEFADADGMPNGKEVYVPATISYEQALKNTTIWTSTVMLSLAKLSKQNIFMPNVKRGQDTATWWKILKKISYAYGLNEVLSYYRRTSNSLSANKFIALKRTWHLYRVVEGLSVTRSVYNFAWYGINACRRRA